MSVLAWVKISDVVASARCESESVEFKRELAVDAPGALCEIVKDIVAMANSGGGVILIGVDDDGGSSSSGSANLARVDSAQLCDQVFRYTAENFGGLGVFEGNRGAGRCLCIAVEPTSYPLVFAKAGSYENPPGKARIAFNAGTIYVRHGAKSEPATGADIRAFCERIVSRQREAWLGGIRKIVEAPADSHIEVLVGARQPVRIVNDETAPAVTLRGYRQMLWMAA